jgi:hypothetical protein
MRSAKQGVATLMTSKLANNIGPKVRVDALIAVSYTIKG